MSVPDEALAGLFLFFLLYLRSYSCSPPWVFCYFRCQTFLEKFASIGNKEFQQLNFMVKIIWSWDSVPAKVKWLSAYLYYYSIAYWNINSKVLQFTRFISHSFVIYFFSLSSTSLQKTLLGFSICQSVLELVKSSIGKVALTSMLYLLVYFLLEFGPIIFNWLLVL